MKIPERIQIVDSHKTTGPRMSFGIAGENTPDRQLRYLAQKLNEVIDYLRALPSVPNEIDVTTKNGKHEHNWILDFRLDSIGHYNCSDCHERMTKAVTVRRGR